MCSSFRAQADRTPSFGRQCSFLLRPFPQSVSGIGLTTDKTLAEDTILGPPEDVNADGYHFYDNGNFVVLWEDDNTPSFLIARSDFQGQLTLTIEDQEVQRGIGDSFSDIAPTDTDGSEIAQALYRLLVDPAVDCIADAICEVAPFEDGFEISYPGGFFGFSNDEAKTLDYTSA